ncbi:hypothetical protein H4R35_003035 [Dimargaris xerosporica]|nr:hypothetical protein H4R35_003035 [Dimargaris xerosporica]
MGPRSLTIPPEPNLETGKIIDVDTGEVLDAAPLCTATARLPPAPIEAGPSLKAHWLATRSSNHQPLALTGTGNDRSPPHFTDADNSDRFELLVDWPTGTNSSCPNGHGGWSFRSHPTSATPTPAGSSWRFETPVLSLVSTSTRNPQALVLYRPDHSQSLTDAMVPSGQLPSTIHHQSPSPSALPTPLLTSLAPLQPASESNGSPSSPEATAMDLD